MVETERAEQGVVTGAEIVGAGELHVDDLDLVAPRFVITDGAACEGGKLFHLPRRSRLVGRIARRVGDHLAVDQDRLGDTSHRSGFTALRLPGPSKFAVSRLSL